jgi:hypothetical protein
MASKTDAPATKQSMLDKLTADLAAEEALDYRPRLAEARAASETAAVDALIDPGQATVARADRAREALLAVGEEQAACIDKVRLLRVATTQLAAELAADARTRLVDAHVAARAELKAKIEANREAGLVLVRSCVELEMHSGHFFREKLIETLGRHSGLNVDRLIDAAGTAVNALRAGGNP